MGAIPGGRTTKLFGAALALVLSCAWLWLHYGTVLRDPGAHLFNDHQDGLKNYFGFAWHARYGSDPWQFEGMNHPYGEHIGYLDAQPLFCNAWRAVLHLAPDQHVNSVALVNLLMLFALPISALFFYLVLVELRVPWWYAAICAVPIAFISPQIERMYWGHYALAYGYWIPATWWLLLRSMRGGWPWAWSAALGAWILCGLWVHVYLGFICAAFVIIANGLDRLMDRSRVLGKYAPGLYALSALIFFGAMMGITDVHADRTMHPTGFFQYRTTLAMLLTPGDEWEDAPFRALFGDGYGWAPEGRNYPGLGALLWVGILCLLIISRSFTERCIPVLQAMVPTNMRGPLLAAVVLLLFAFGLPFVPGITDGWLWDVPVLRQFRAPSRFAWVIVPMLATMACHAAWLAWAAQKTLIGKALTSVVLLGIPMLSTIEGHGYNTHAAFRIQGHRNVFLEEGLDPVEQELVAAIRKQPASALLILPYFHDGAEEIMVPYDPAAARLAQVLAYHTGLPMINSMATRTSITEAEQQIRASGPTWYERPTMPFRGNERILVIANDTLLDKYDRDIVRRTRLLSKHGAQSLLELQAVDLLADERAATSNNWRTAFNALPDNGAGGWRPEAPLIEDGFEGRTATHVHNDHGAFACKLSEHPTVGLDGNVLDVGVEYELSFWYYNRGPFQRMATACVITTYASGEQQWSRCTDPRYSRCIDGDWSLVELTFHLDHEDDALQLYMEGDRLQTDSAWMDDLLVRRLDTDVYRLLPQQGDRAVGVQRNGEMLPL
ncbi:MAG: hypothetical protein WAU70_01630 [Flavobacteriales bacterium]